MSYIIRSTSELTDNIEAAATAKGESIIRFKDKNKKAYFFAVPSVTENFVLTLIQSDKGMTAAKDWIESLIKAAGKKRFDNGLVFSEADITIDALCSIAEETSDNIRLTKENILAAFDAGWKNTIAFALALERDAVGAVTLCGEDMDAIAAYWNSEAGLKFMQIAANYKSYLIRGAERKPTFETAAIKEKVLNAIANLDQEDQLVSKLVTKLQDAPLATVDADAL